MPTVLRKILSKMLGLDADYRGVVLYPPGHFYSPLVTHGQLLANESKLIDVDGLLWGNVDLQPDVQEQTLKKLVKAQPPDFPKEQTAGSRYYSGNSFFGYGSAAILSAVMRTYRPKRIVEVGSGFSSAVMLDTAERYDLPMNFTFVEPHPERLRSLLRSQDLASARVIEAPVQDVELDIFQALEANDLLFIDSSHVVKPGSDLADLFFRVIPSLKPGCIVHLHDIFYPEIYPRDWLLSGVSWNETFLLRAFLLFNESFKVIFFNAYAQKKFTDVLSAWDARVATSEMSSIWIQRVA